MLDGLSALEYRGYDSAGVSLFPERGDIRTIKTAGRLAALRKELEGEALPHSCVGIGHTRWATHGVPCRENAHPHTTPLLSLVHNGIIENYAELEKELTAAGYVFSSDTDTERAADFIDLCYRRTGDPLKALFESADRLRGSYAFGVLFADRPGRVYFLRKDSPLIAASDADGSFIASDLPALLSYTRDYYRVPENVVGELNREADEPIFYDRDGHVVEVAPDYADFGMEEAKKGGYPFFMEKEIFEEPAALRKTVSPRIGGDGLPYFDLPFLDDDRSLRGINRIHIVACGTAMHAGLVGKALIERYARLPVSVEIASEFRYGNPILDERDLVILLSQSGETSDTLAALRHAKRCGVRTLAIVNVMGSSVARESDAVLYTWAGPEIAVASTKAYSVQCALLFLLAIRLATANGKLDVSEAVTLCRTLRDEVPVAVEKALRQSDEVKELSAFLAGREHVFYIGRNLDYSLCVEASLKLKEISYIHSEAYAAGELKHGTISLITPGVPVVALLSVSTLAEKTVSGIREVTARGGEVLALASPSVIHSTPIPAAHLLQIPELPEPFSLFPATTLLQLLAYHTSARMRLDVDKPRNLAKSVTVE